MGTAQRQDRPQRLRTGRDPPRDRAPLPSTDRGPGHHRPRNCQDRALKVHRARQAAERLAAGPHWTDTGYVFTTEAGDPIPPATLRRAFRALLKTAGIPAKQPTEQCPKPGLWHPREMRHSAGSYMDAMGVPHEKIAAILGHEGTRTTEGVYIHGQEIIDMTSAAFETFGNQFGNQTAEGSR